MSPSPLRRLSTFLSELKRRRVYQVTAVYVVLAIGGLEVLDLLVPTTSLPGWASPLILSIAVAGLPTVVVLAWTFDITPGGVVRTGELHDDSETATGAQATTRGDSDAIRRTESRRSDAEAPGSTESASSTETGPSPLAVAVLPFDNLSGGADAEPFVMGLHDDLLTELSRASALTVISRTSVRSYRGTEKSMREVAAELGAGTIVEGGVQRVMAALKAQLTASEEERFHKPPTRGVT